MDGRGGCGEDLSRCFAPSNVPISTGLQPDQSFEVRREQELSELWRGSKDVFEKSRASVVDSTPPRPLSDTPIEPT